MSRNRAVTSLALLLTYSLSVHLGVPCGYLLTALILPGGIFSLTVINSGRHLFLMLFFLAEYLLRIRRFSETEHPGFIDFMLSLAKVDLKCIKTF
jgi:hypothetical protein